MSRTDRLVSLSGDIKSRALQLYGLQRSIDLVPIGIQSPSFRARSRRSFGFGDDDILLITVGRLVARKGLDQLLDVLAQAPDRRVKLVVVGEGPLMEDLKSRTRALMLKDRVRFLGYVSEEEKLQLLSAADMYVSAALHEGFGIVFLEAMTLGLPIVCFNEGGQTDFLRHGITAFLVKLNDHDTFAAYITRLCRDAQLRKRMGENGRRAAMDYSIERCASEYMKIYTEAVDTRHTSPR